MKKYTLLLVALVALVILLFFARKAEARGYRHFHRYHPTQVILKPTPPPVPAPVPVPQPVPVPAPQPTPAPQTGTIKAVDSDWDITNPQWFKDLYASGVRLYIVAGTEWGSCTPENHNLSQLKMALDAGLKIAMYTRDPSCWASGLQSAGPYMSQLQFFAIDIELAGDGVKASPAPSRFIIESIQKLGIRPILYSYKDAWNTLSKNSTAFSDIPLWNSQTTGTFSGYGGWTHAVGTQTKFNVTIGGILTDSNLFDASFMK